MSQKIEVKNIEWLKKEIGNMPYTRLKRVGMEDYVAISKSGVFELINQLDEREVLSQEFIDKHAEHHEYIGYAGVPVDDLQNLLVPKQELPVIPKFVADYINRIKKSGKGLSSAFSYIKAFGWDDESSYEYKVYNWLGIGSNNEIFARAWLDGFTVEKEQKYLVIILDDGIGAYLIYYPKSGNYGVTGTLDDSKGITRFTEQEIKDYDKRFWPFAIKVEELEE